MATRSIEFEMTEPQERFAFSASKHPAMVAGLGAGKSYAGLARLLFKMLASPGLNTGYYLPTYDLIKLRAMPGLEDTLNKLGLEFNTNRSEYRVSIAGFGDMIFRSYDRPERIVAYEVAHSVADELDTLPKDKAALVWRKITERNRQHCRGGNTLGNVTTPDQGLNGFTYAKWGNNPLPGYELIKAATTSNPYLPDGYADQIRANYDPILADLYLNGEFVSLTQGKVYHYFNRTRHHTDRVITADDQRLFIGLDFNIGGCCAVTFVIDKANPIAVDEFVSHDTQDVVININARYAGHKITIHPDASGKAGRTNASRSDIAILEAAGFDVDAPRANPAVRDRINSFNALLSHDRFMVNTDKCPQLTFALESQGYLKGEPEKFSEHPAIDDWCFSGETEVCVNGNVVKFKDAPKSGTVVGFDGREVGYTNLGKKGCFELLDITLENGEVIKATADHLFLTTNGWVRAIDLEGEKLCKYELFQTKSSFLTGFISLLAQMGIFIERSAKKIKPLLGRAGSRCIGMFGKSSTEKFQTDTLSTTMMETRPITRFKTLTWFLIASTAEAIATSATRLLSSSTKELGLSPWKGPLNGIGQKRVGPGIKRITKKIKQAFIWNLMLCVCAAAKSLKAQEKTAIDFAAKSAHQKREEIAELMTSKLLVFGAAKNSKQTSTQRGSTVVLVEKKESGDVYCLTTNDGCFSLASGYVVSNCDGAGYAIHRRYPLGGPAAMRMGYAIAG